MIDFLIGVLIGALAVYAIFHFKGETPQKALTDFTNLETRIKTLMSQAFNDAFAAYQSAVAADKDAAVAAAVAAEQANSQAALDAAKAEGAATEQAEDIAAVEAAHQALAAAPAV